MERCWWCGREVPERFPLDGARFDGVECRLPEYLGELERSVVRTCFDCTWTFAELVHRRRLEEVYLARR